MGIQINGQTDIISATDGGLTVQGADLSNISNLNVSGIVTASSFVGDGTNLTGVFQGLNAKAYTSPGTFTVGTDCPSTITQIKIIACGGGGNGGNGGLYSNPVSTPGGGGGGGGGATANIFYRTVSNGQVYTITIGGAGGNTTIAYPGPTVLYTCNAGSPGGTGGNGAPTLIGPGGTPGAAGAISPQAFALSYRGTAGGAGGAGSLEANGPGIPNVNDSGSGGDGGFNQIFQYILGVAGGYGGGGTTNSTAAATPGTAAANYGSGGGGGAGRNHTTTIPAPLNVGGTGAAGYQGICVIEW